MTLIPFSASGITRMVDDEDKGSHELETPGAVALAVMLNVAPADLAAALTTLDEEATA